MGPGDGVESGAKLVTIDLAGDKSADKSADKSSESSEKSSEKPEGEQK